MGKSKIEELFKLEIKRRAKMEFLVVEEECRELLKQGCSKITVYRLFKESAKISMSYNTFMHYLRPRKSVVATKTAGTQTQVLHTPPKSVSTSAPLGQSTPAISHKNTFSDEDIKHLMGD